MNEKKFLNSIKSTNFSNLKNKELNEIRKQKEQLNTQINAAYAMGISKTEGSIAKGKSNF